MEEESFGKNKVFSPIKYELNINNNVVINVNDNSSPKRMVSIENNKINQNSVNYLRKIPIGREKSFEKDNQEKVNNMKIIRKIETKRIKRKEPLASRGRNNFCLRKNIMTDA